MAAASGSWSGHSRAAKVGVALLMLIATAGCSTDTPDSSAETSSPPVSVSPTQEIDVGSYVAEALSFIEENGIHVKDIDWDNIRATVLEQTADAGRPAETHPALIEALRQAGGRHSSLRPPSQPVAAGYIAKPTAAESGHGVVVVEVPPFTSHIPDHVDEYATAGAKAIVEHADQATCGWVIDLSRNSGGNMWPMLASLTPLLPDGQVMQFIDRDGNRSTARVSGNSVFLDDQLMATADGVDSELPSRPVAIVQSNRTASSAEAVLLSFLDRQDVRTFGSATAGLATGNVAKTLPDGSVLVVTSSYMATNSGQVFKGPIPPTTPAPENPVQEATDWLQSSC